MDWAGGWLGCFFNAADARGAYPPCEPPEGRGGSVAFSDLLEAVDGQILGTSWTIRRRGSESARRLARFYKMVDDARGAAI